MRTPTDAHEEEHMAEIEECCGWLGWAAMAGIDANGRRMRSDDGARVAPVMTAGTNAAAARGRTPAEWPTGCTPHDRDAA